MASAFTGHRLAVDPDLAGSALVVGASSDIGRAIARKLAERGLKVCGWGRHRQRLEETVGACDDLTPGATSQVVDVRDLGAMERALHAPLLRAGRLQVVVWAAGLFDWAPGGRADPTSAADVLTVNLTAAAALTAMVRDRLVEHGSAALVYVGSSAAHVAFADNAAYVASKHGLSGLAQATWLDLRTGGIKVSLISPGLVAAGAGLAAPAARTSPEQLLQPEDVATAVAFVLDASSRCCPTTIRLEPRV